MSFTFPKPRTTLLCGLLLCASFINYMDRQTLAELSPEIKGELKLSNEQYGSVESAFGFAFAAGSLVFGYLADLWSVRWLYPAVLVAWSLVGIATGFVETLNDLILCRLFLGFFEAGHWPCAMQATRRVLEPGDRGLGNSVLQSGASFGAIVTPLIILTMLKDEPGSWRAPFIILGSVGLLWVAGWLLTVRSGDLAPRPEESEEGDVRVFDVVIRLMRDRRFWVLLVMVVAINTTWQIFRVWRNLSLVEGHGYAKTNQLTLSTCYYVATDVGCLVAGFMTKWLHAKGKTIVRSRQIVYSVCAAMAALSVCLPLFGRGPALVAIWLIMGMGALGVFPCYYSFSQDISARHAAKAFGLLSAMAWCVTSLIQMPFGAWVDRLKLLNDPHRYDYGLAIAGILPIIAAIPLWLFWPNTETSKLTDGTPESS